MLGIPTREAIVLAAGFSRRFGGTQKQLVKLGPLRLIHYPLASLASVGIKRVWIVVREDSADSMREAAEAIFTGEVKLCINSRPELENGYSLYVGLNCASSDHVVVTVSDHIYPPSAVARVAETYVRSGAEIVVAGDRSPSFVDEGEATKVLTDSGNYVVRAGKDLRRYNFIDAGIFMVNRVRMLRHLERLVRRGEAFGITDAVNYVAKHRGARVADITGIPWTDVDTLEDQYAVSYGWRKPVVDHVLREVFALAGGVERAASLGEC